MSEKQRTYELFSDGEKFGEAVESRLGEDYMFIVKGPGVAPCSIRLMRAREDTTRCSAFVWCSRGWESVTGDPEAPLQALAKAVSVVYSVSGVELGVDERATWKAEQAAVPIPRREPTAKGPD